MNITRRNFIKLGVGAGLTLAMGGFSNLLFADEKKASEPDMVALRNGTPAQMFEKGIAEIGGMSRFVKKGQIVLVKPNIGWARTPAEGANTQPDLVAKIVELALKEGAKKVYVFDNTCNNWKDCYNLSGIEKAVIGAGGTIVSGNKKESYRKKEINNSKILKNAMIHELYLDSDVIINVPVLKHHGSSQMTSSLKNLMGVVWNRDFYHNKGLHQCIADFPLIRKPDLTVIDAFNVMFKNGPRGISKADIASKRMQIIATDMVAADTAAAKILEFDPAGINYLKFAQDLGIGTMAIDKLKINKVTL
ncbi:MAG: DUF362 domain-containing protein [Candidatus Wallbacteria bacterium]